jgi:hypothetical protein
LSLSVGADTTPKRTFPFVLVHSCIDSAAAPCPSRLPPRPLILSRSHSRTFPARSPLSLSLSLYPAFFLVRKCLNAPKPYFVAHLAWRRAFRSLYMCLHDGIYSHPTNVPYVLFFCPSCFGRCASLFPLSPPPKIPIARRLNCLMDSCTNLILPCEKKRHEPYSHQVLAGMRRVHTRVRSWPRYFLQRL